MSHKILVLSDLHLGEQSRDSRYIQFLQVLKTFINSDIQELLLMGDVFDILIGNKKFWKKIHPDFFEALNVAKSQNKQVTWVQGNHDFLLSDLVKPYNVKCIENHEILTRENIVISVSHGDLADSSNKLHLLWRSFLNSKLLQLFVFLVPELLAEKLFYPLTLKLSKTSRHFSKNKEYIDRATTIFRKHAQDLQKQYNADLILLGHSHIFDDFNLQNDARYLNIASWYETPQLALIEINDRSFDIKVSPISSWLESSSK
ncbi:MAG: metallophosphoesterase [Bdellovibrionota bacterium]